MGQVTLRGVHKRFGATEVIRGVDLEVAEGEFLVFATSDGTIKKTSLSAYGNIRSNGLIALNIEDGNRLVAVRRSTGTSFSPKLPPTSNVCTRNLDGSMPSVSAKALRSVWTPWLCVVRSNESVARS